MIDPPQPQAVLLVSREPTLSQLTAAALRKRLRVDVVQEPEQALAALSAQRYAAVLVNLSAFEARAWDLLQRLRAVPDHPPIVVLTTDSTFETRTRLNALGVHRLVYMPFHLDSLRSAVAPTTLLH